MTTAGVEIFNDSGSILLDANIGVMTLLAKGTATVSSISTVMTTWTGGTRPLLAMKSAALVGNLGATLSGSTWTFRAMVGNLTPPTAVDWYLFDVNTPGVSLGDPGFGLEIFDDGGTRVFSSGSQPGRVRDVIYGPYASVIASHTYDSGRTYASIQAPGCPIDSVGTGEGFGFTDLIMSKFASNVMTIDMDFAMGSDTFDTYNTHAGFIVVDVTNF